MHTFKDIQARERVSACILHIHKYYYTHTHIHHRFRHTRFDTHIQTHVHIHAHTIMKFNRADRTVKNDTQIKPSSGFRIFDFK